MQICFLFCFTRMQVLKLFMDKPDNMSKFLEVLISKLNRNEYVNRIALHGILVFRFSLAKRYLVI